MTTKQTEAISTTRALKLALEAGFVVDEKAQQHQPNCIFHTHHMVDELLERFAALVAAAAVEREREACAKVCEAYTDNDGGTFIDHEGHGYACAAAIRARGE